jgi:phospholipase/carboxylesterase
MPTPQTPPTPPAPAYELPFESLPAEGAPSQLVVLLHGWASEPAAMLPLADALRQRFPQAALLAPRGPHPADAGRRGFQWYSIQGISEHGVWAARVRGMVLELQAWVRAQQQRLNCTPAATALAGFSQGGILSLALALHDDGIAGRVLSFGGCLVDAPAAAPRHATIHLFHGTEDRVIPAERSRSAIEQFGALQADATLDMAEGVGHELHPALVDCAMHRLTSYIPQRTWREALGAGPAPD